MYAWAKVNPICLTITEIQKKHGLLRLFLCLLNNWFIFKTKTLMVIDRLRCDYLCIVYITVVYVYYIITSRYGVCLALPLTTELHGGWEYATAIFVFLNFFILIFIAGGQILLFRCVIGIVSLLIAFCTRQSRTFDWCTLQFDGYLIPFSRRASRRSKWCMCWI